MNIISCISIAQCPCPVLVGNPVLYTVPLTQRVSSKSLTSICTLFLVITWPYKLRWDIMVLALSLVRRCLLLGWNLFLWILCLLLPLSAELEIYDLWKWKWNANPVAQCQKLTPHRIILPWSLSVMFISGISQGKHLGFWSVNWI